MDNLAKRWKIYFQSLRLPSLEALCPRGWKKRNIEVLKPSALNHAGLDSLEEFLATRPMDGALVIGHSAARAALPLIRRRHPNKPILCFLPGSNGQEDLAALYRSSDHILVQSPARRERLRSEPTGFPPVSTLNGSGGSRDRAAKLIHSLLSGLSQKALPAEVLLGTEDRKRLRRTTLVHLRGGVPRRHRHGSRRIPGSLTSALQEYLPLAHPTPREANRLIAKAKGEYLALAWDPVSPAQLTQSLIQSLRLLQDPQAGGVFTSIWSEPPSSAVLRQTALQRTGLPDPRLGLGRIGVLDFCLRLKQAGCRGVALPDASRAAKGRQARKRGPEEILRRDVFVRKWCQFGIRALDELDEFFASDFRPRGR